jgi:hypothetical protein
MAQTTAPAADAQLANKKYVDDQIAAAIAAAIPDDDAFGTRTETDSGSNQLVKTSVYKAGSDGFVMAWGNGNGIVVLSDSSNPPTTTVFESDTNGSKESVTVPIKKDDYVKITFSGTLTNYWWLPIGSGTLVKQ